MAPNDPSPRRPADESHRAPFAVSAGATGEAIIVDEVTPRSATLFVSSRRANATVVALIVMAFLLVTQEITPFGLISAISDDLGVSEARVGLLTTAFTLANMLATLPLAFLTTRWGRRNATVFATLVWCVGVLVVAIAPSFEVLLAGRAITGAGHALWWAVAGPGAAGMFARAVRGKTMTRLQIGSASAGVIGLPLVTVAAGYVPWQTPFWVLLGGGLVLAVATYVLMPNYKTGEGTAPRGDIPSWWFWARVLTVLTLLAASMGLTWTYIQPFLTEVTGFSDGAMPWIFALGGVFGVASTIVVSRVVDRHPIRSVAVAATLLLTGWSMLGFLGSNQVAALIGVGIHALGWAGLVGALVAWSMRHTPLPSDIGIGIHGMGYNAGFAIGSLAGAWLFTAIGIGNLPIVSAGLTLVAALIVATVSPIARRPARMLSWGSSAD